MRKVKAELPPQNARIKNLIGLVADGNVTAFMEKLNGISHQSLNRIFNVDKRTSKYPGVSSQIISAIAKGYDVNPYWILTGTGEMYHDGQGPKSAITKPGSDNYQAVEPTLENVMISLGSIQKGLNKVHQHQVRARAEIRGFGEYQVMKDARNDENRRVAIMAQISKLIDENLETDELKDMPA